MKNILLSILEGILFVLFLIFNGFGRLFIFIADKIDDAMNYIDAVKEDSENEE